MMRWQKMGRIGLPLSKLTWSEAYAQVPTLLLMSDRLRVYFSTRPKQDMTLITFCDLDLADLSKVIYVHDKPILELGDPGTFDQHGTMPSAAVASDGLVYLYYSGWSRSTGVPYNNFTGLAVSEDGGTTFRKMFKGPVIDRTPEELYSATSPEVLKEEDGWSMWYCSGTDWHRINDKLEHAYDIKYAHSTDGVRWTQTGKVAIRQKDKYEAITKPAVIADGGLYHMWYCYRGSFNFRGGSDAYRVGYATSNNKVDWVRKDDQAGIEPSADGWDSEMIAYPAVIKIGNDVYLFYNGNHFGKEGFGYAKLINN